MTTIQRAVLLSVHRRISQNASRQWDSTTALLSRAASHRLFCLPTTRDNIRGRLTIRHNIAWWIVVVLRVWRSVVYHDLHIVTCCQVFS